MNADVKIRGFMGETSWVLTSGSYHRPATSDHLYNATFRGGYSGENISSAFSININIASSNLLKMSPQLILPHHNPKTTN